MDPDARPPELIRALATTIERIEATTQQLTAAQLRTSPEPGAWSPNEILWHIRATADVYGEHIARILDEDTPSWRHVSPRARMKKSRYDELPFAESFAGFTQQRNDLIALLKRIPAQAWQRVALVRVQNKADDWRLSLQKRVWGLADHEQGHCAQMESTAAALQTGKHQSAGQAKR